MTGFEDVDTLACPDSHAAEPTRPPNARSSPDGPPPPPGPTSSRG